MGSVWRSNATAVPVRLRAREPVAQVFGRPGRSLVTASSRYVAQELLGVALPYERHDLELETVTVHRKRLQRQSVPQHRPTPASWMSLA